eukprot:2346578-Rhodomonas_salina.2
MEEYSSGFGGPASILHPEATNETAAHARYNSAHGEGAAEGRWGEGEYGHHVVQQVYVTNAPLSPETVDSQTQAGGESWAAKRSSTGASAGERRRTSTSRSSLRTSSLPPPARVPRQPLTRAVSPRAATRTASPRHGCEACSLSPPPSRANKPPRSSAAPASKRPLSATGTSVRGLKYKALRPAR